MEIIDSENKTSDRLFLPDQTDYIDDLEKASNTYMNYCKVITLFFIRKNKNISLFMQKLFIFKIKCYLIAYLE